MPKICGRVNLTCSAISNSLQTCFFYGHLVLAQYYLNVKRMWEVICWWLEAELRTLTTRSQNYQNKQRRPVFVWRKYPLNELHGSLEHLHRFSATTLTCFSPLGRRWDSSSSTAPTTSFLMAYSRASPVWMPWSSSSSMIDHGPFLGSYRLSPCSCHFHRLCQIDYHL